MHNNAYDTLSQAVNALTARGYTQSFSVEAAGLSCTALGRAFPAEQFHVDEFHRFEGNTDPADAAIVYAITAADGTRGTLVTAYGAITQADPAILRRLTID